jgi:hypothetical protein
MITFARWYYVTTTKSLLEVLLDLFGLVSSVFAIRIMWQHISEPMYQDYTWQGRVIGFAIRSLRILLGLFVEGIIVLILAVVMLVWLVLPLLVVVKILYTLFTLHV